MKHKLNIKYFPVLLGVLLFLQLLINSGELFVVPLFFIYITLAGGYAFGYKLQLKRSLVLLFFLIGIYIIYGFGNGGWFQDSRLSITWFVVLILTIDLFKKIPVEKSVKVLLSINILVLLIYTLLAMGLSNGFFSNSDLPAYVDYRTQGPPLYTFYLLPFIYLITERENDFLLHLNGFLGGTAILINGSGQSFAIFLAIYGLVYVKLKKRATAVKSAIGLLVLTLLLVFIVTNFADPRLKNKLGNIFSPLQSSTVQTRLSDLAYVLNEPRSRKEIILGHGIGKSSTVYRINPASPSLSRSRTFLEIDNGIYYIFNRFGILGLLLLFYSHYKLFRRPDTLKAKFAFLLYFFATNLLSIHYWTNYEGALFIGVIIALVPNINYKEIKHLKSE